MNNKSIKNIETAKNLLAQAKQLKKTRQNYRCHKYIIESKKT